MSDEEKDGGISTKEIVDAIRDSQEGWASKLFWNPAAVGFMTLVFLVAVAVLVSLSQTEDGQQTLQMLFNVFNLFN